MRKERALSEYSDRRTRRTERALREALVALLQEKPLSRITVSDVIELADIGRSTFYRHYQDVPSMAESMGAALIGEVREILYDKTDADSRSLSADCINAVMSYLRNDKTFFLALIGPNGDARFSRALDDMFCQFARDRFWSNFEGGKKNPLLPLLFTFCYSGLRSLLQAWLEGECAEDEERVACIAENLEVHSQRAFLETAVV